MSTARVQIQTYRRKSNRLEWHFREDCRKYPFDNFEESSPNMKVMQAMVCPICQRLRAEENGAVDTRNPKAIGQGFFSRIFGPSN